MEEPIPAFVIIWDIPRVCPKTLSIAVYSQWDIFLMLCSWTAGALCNARERKSGNKGHKGINRQGGSLSCPPLTPALLINEAATSHPSLVFSFRPSWSSSTPAYGTLLPWGRTMRRPLPVSPFFPHLFSRCRFRHIARQHSLSLSPPLSPCISLSTYLSFLSY